MTERDVDEDARRDAIDEHRRMRRLTQCQCGNDLPGQCPGPQFCPYSDFANGDEDEDDTAPPAAAEAD